MARTSACSPCKRAKTRCDGIRRRCQKPCFNCMLCGFAATRAIVREHLEHTCELRSQVIARNIHGYGAACGPCQEAEVHCDDTSRQCRRPFFKCVLYGFAAALLIVRESLQWHAGRLSKTLQMQNLGPCQNTLRTPSSSAMTLPFPRCRTRSGHQWFHRNLAVPRGETPGLPVLDGCQRPGGMRVLRHRAGVQRLLRRRLQSGCLTVSLAYRPVNDCDSSSCTRI